MAFWNGWFARKSVTNSLDLLRELLGDAAARSGVTVNWKTALETVTVLACVRVIADGCAQVPFRLMLQQGRVRNPAADHPLHDLLYRKPNDFQTSYEFREQILFHLVLTLNSYVFISRGLDGRVLELLPFEPGWVTTEQQRFGEAPVYKVRLPKGAQIDVPAVNMWHLRGPSWNGWMGMDGVKLLREAIGLAKATEDFGAQFFANGARPGGILKTDQQLGAEKIAELKAAWASAQEGTGNRMKMAVLAGGLSYESLSQTADEAQFIETRKFQIEEICRGLRVMPVMAGVPGAQGAYDNGEQMFIAHVVHSLMPWYARIEQSVDVNLLTDEERAQGYYAKLFPQALMRGANKDRAEYYAKALGSGGHAPWMTQNEVRDLEDMNPADAADADTLKQPVTAAKPASTAPASTAPAANA